MTEESCPKLSDEAGAAAVVKQRRKRKWDQPAESLFSSGLALSGSLPIDIGSLKGNIVTPSLNSALVKIQDELIAREIVINDADASVRAKLTKRQMQEDIQRSTGAVVITRGKYRPPNVLPDNEKPLYLHISAGANLKHTAERIKAVDRAASMVEEILKQGHSTTLIPTSFSTINAGTQVLQSLTKSVYLGFDPDPSVNIAARIRGPNDQYISHIMNETGATVMLRGKGSGTVGISNSGEMEEPLHLYISSCNHKNLEAARILAENLLDTIALEVGASRIAPSKVYKAVPPPRQLLDGIISTVPACSSINAPMSSFSNPSIAAHVSGSFPDNGNIGLGGANCSWYEGIYPQATPLQQVASVLRGTLVSASPPSMVATGGTSLWKNSCSGEEANKRPQRRKFQELPVVLNGPTTFHQSFFFLRIQDSPWTPPPIVCR
ncbi:RS2-interacting KH protein isoform X2 [Wolffia australiana]